MSGYSKEALNVDYASYKKSSKRVVVLGVIAGLMTVATIVLAVLYGINVSSTSPIPPEVVTTPIPPKTGICETQDCVTAASRILNAMNREAEPCDDFFEYACGIWVRDHIIPDDKSSASTFSDLRDDVSKVIKRVLESDAPTTSSSVTKAKTFYSSCMNTTYIDSLGKAPVLDLIAEMGGWPVIGDSFDPDTFNFEATLGMFRSRFGTSSILSSWLSADDKNSSANIIKIDQPSLGMPGRDYYLSESTRDKVEPAYKQYMGDLMKMLAGSSADDAKINNVVEEIVQLETDLASAMAPDSERRDSLAIYKKLSLAELSSVNSEIDWIAYVNSFLEVTSEKLTVDETEEVVIYAEEYIKSVTNIVNQRWELVQNYLVWRVLKGRTSYMGSELRSTGLPYTQATSGTTSEEARWMSCSDTTNDYFPMPVGSLFVEENFSEENKDATLQMVEDLRTVFKEMLPGNDWMDQPTKDAASKKADLMNPIIAYPDYIVEEPPTKMDDEYADVMVDVTTYFQNIQGLVEYEWRRSLDKLRKPFDFNEWFTSPAIVNAFYSSSRNQIVFPAGILQPPFFDKGQPMSMNYGAIGMVIGHEITHGFDDSGAQYDGYGNLENWWTNSSQEQFDVRAECMVDQYSAIQWETADNNYIDGRLTLGENIADNGGLRQAFMAYKKWQEVHPEGDLRLPGLGDFTQEQLFFLGFAQVWCGSYTPEYALRLLKTDSHSPGIYRVQVPSFNYPEFGEAYNCIKGKDDLYPDKSETCRVW